MDAADLRGDIMRLLHAACDGGPGVIHIRQRGLDLVVGLTNQRADLDRGFAGALGQLAHFIGHYRKPAALFTRAGGFDGSVKRQQIGLVRNLFDHADDVGDLAGALAQCRQRLGR